MILSSSVGAKVIFWACLTIDLADGHLLVDAGLGVPTDRAVDADDPAVGILGVAGPDHGHGLLLALYLHDVAGGEPQKPP